MQWTRLPGGETPRRSSSESCGCCHRRSKPATGSAAAAGRASVGASTAPQPVAAPGARRRRSLAIGVRRSPGARLLHRRQVRALEACARQCRTAPAPAARAPRTTAFAPPPHSIAVLPFVNMSGDKEQEYFSDGLTEELLNSLARINELQVAARTSAFYFKGKDTDIGTIARKLNVAAVLEGSVRRSGHTVRITAQLINAVTGFHLWSETYDRDLGDVLKLQTEIATAVASALKVTLLGDVAARIELGGTHNPAAFDAYLRGSEGGHVAPYCKCNGSGDRRVHRGDSTGSATTRWHSPAGRSHSMTTRGVRERSRAFVSTSRRRRPTHARRSSSRRIWPRATWRWRGSSMAGALDFARAGQEYERALALAPGNAQVHGRLRCYGYRMGAGRCGHRGRPPRGGPGSAEPGHALGLAAALSVRASLRARLLPLTGNAGLRSGPSEAYGYRGLAYYALGDFQSARSSCETQAGLLAESAVPGYRLTTSSAAMPMRKVCWRS